MSGNSSKASGMVVISKGKTNKRTIILNPSVISGHVMPEARLHLLESVEAWDIGHIQLLWVSETLVTERETFWTSESGSDSVTSTAGLVISSLSSTELHFLHGIQWTWVLFEVHGLEGRLCESSKSTLGEARVRKFTIDTALVEGTVWVNWLFRMAVSSN